MRIPLTFFLYTFFSIESNFFVCVSTGDMRKTSIKLSIPNKIMNDFLYIK